MMNFHSKITPLLTFVFLLGFSGPGLTQDEEVGEAVTPEVESEAPPQVFHLTLQGRNITVADDQYARAAETPSATGSPLKIEPNPYLDKDMFSSAKVESFRTAQNENGEGVEEIDLDPLNLDSIGLLSANGEGFPVDLWQQSSVRDLLELMSGLPGGTSSPTANALKRKLLLSSASFPITLESGVQVEDLLYQRLAQLYNAGDLASLLGLFEQIPTSDRSPRISRLMVQAYLLDGDIESACLLAKIGQREEGTPDWLKITAICMVLEGQESKARFNLTLLNETGDMDFAYQGLFEDVAKLASGDTDFSTLAMEEGDGALANFFSGQFFLLSDLTPLHVAILKLLGRNVDVALEDNAEVSNILLAALARWSGLTLETKLEVADRALAKGILEQAFLSDLVGAYTFSPQDKETAHLLDYESWGVKSDALFYALAQEAFDPEIAIGHIREGWARARHESRAAFIAELYMDAIEDIAPNRAYISFAPDAARIALLSGNWQVALSWYETVRALASSGDAEATRMLVEMWPLMVTMDVSEEIPYSPQILKLWRKSLEILPIEDQLARAQILYKVFEVLNLQVPEDLLAEGLLTRGSNERLEFIGGVSLGETVLKVLGILGASGAEKAAPATLANVIYTLIEAGLEEEARSLALEALLARGF